jgi:hypothetical protein
VPFALGCILIASTLAFVKRLQAKKLALGDNRNGEEKHAFFHKQQYADEF